MPQLFTEKSALNDFSPPKSEPDSLENYVIVEKLHTGRWNTAYIAVIKGNFSSKYIIRKYLNINIQKYNLQKDLIDKQRLLISLNYCQYCSVRTKCKLFPETRSIFYDENRNLYFVQEFVTGIELSDVMTHFPNGLPETAVIFISAQVLIAMEYLHRANILVRDIHANGIIVQRNGFIRICSMTFGEVLEIDYSSSKSMKGRVAFFPPEFLVKHIWTKEADC
ncbi:Serine/Threonine kinase domain protein-like protein, partial [Leptotrombidium deliense]